MMYQKDLNFWKNTKKEGVITVALEGKQGIRGKEEEKSSTRVVLAEEKKKKSDVPVLAALPVFGRKRITRPKERQCDIIVGEKETGKRKAMKSNEQPQATRPKLQVEFPEAATVSPSAFPEMAVSLDTGVRDSSSRLPCPATASIVPSPVIVALSQTGVTCQSSAVKAVSSQTGGKETPILSPSPFSAVTSQVDAGLVRNTFTLPEMLTFQCCILYPTNNLRSPSVGLDRCTSVIVKETMGDSKLLLGIKQAHNAMAGREEFSSKTEMPFGTFVRLCNSSDMLYSQGNQEQNYPSHKEGSLGAKLAMEELAENTDTETPVRHDVFQQTSACRSSSFDNDADKQSAETGLGTILSALALHVPRHNFPGAMGNSVKIGAIEGSYDINIEPAWSDCIAVRKTLNQIMHKCEEGSWISQKERPTSSMDSSVKAPSEKKEDPTSHIVEVTEFGAEKHVESSLSCLKSGVFRGKVGVFDSDLTSFCQVEAGMRKREISCDASTNTSVEVSNQFGLQSREVFTGGDISDLATGNKSPSLGPDYQREVANDGLAKDVGDILKIQGLTEAYHRFSSTRNAVDSSSHDNLSTTTRLGPLHDIEMSQDFKMGKADIIAGKGIECQEMGMEAAKFECRKYTPSNAQWAHLSSDSCNHSENSVKDRGRQYPSENDYSHSLTSAGGILFDRKVSNSMDTDSKLFGKQAQEHTGCFPSEKESLVEEENVDHPSATNSNGKGFGLLTKNSTKNILTDSSKHNSPISTPGGMFCESISKSSTVKRPEKALMGPIYLKSTNLGGQASVKKSRNVLQTGYGSSVRKKDLKTPNVRAGSSFASQISPRIGEKASYTLCNLKSFIPLVQQKQVATSIMTRKSGELNASLLI